MIRRSRSLAIGALAGALVLATIVVLPGPAGAGAGPVACGQVITQSTTLGADVGPCDGAGIRVGADGITLSLGGHSVLGNFDQGKGGEHVGIDLTGRTGVTVTRGRVAGFEAGVVIDGGGGNAIRNLTVEDNVGPQNLLFAGLGDGIAVFTSGHNTIANNVIRRNGHFDGVAMLGAGTDHNVFENNVVQANFGAGEDLAVGSGFGVIFNAFLSFPSPTPSVSLVGNVVRGNSVIGNDTSGITSINNINGVIQNNSAVNNGRGPTAQDSGYGSGIDLEHRPTATTQTNMLIQGNRAHGNGVSGIRLGLNSLANRVLGNDARGNGNFIRPGYGWDLHDENPGCTGGGLVNVWRANAFFTVFQGCESGLPLARAASRSAAAEPAAPPASRSWVTRGP
jgi:hypothetical protein